jgi:transposase-like protein
MAARTAKGKIARDQWPLIAERRQNGETYKSIARTYGCTPPAIRYIVGHERFRPPGQRPIEKRSARLESPEAKAEKTVGAIDRALRDRVNSDIAAFVVAFDNLLDSATAENHRALLDATDRLMRAGARTRICLVS